ncbi:hypothetical protein V1477_014952 [Vespula maculifrons]|uniref:Uncharacterized protein n=1 Tax=Vespula maculifrons TaxID=7453 RepID=A0ABD2BIW2_VESMC
MGNSDNRYICYLRVARTCMESFGGENNDVEIPSVVILPGSIYLVNDILYYAIDISKSFNKTSHEPRKISWPSFKEVADINL